MKTITIAHITQLHHDKRLAEEELQRALEQAWPVGSSVLVMLSSVQKRPTIAIVEGHSPDYIRVRLTKPRHRGYGTVKCIWYPKMVTPPIG